MNYLVLYSSRTGNTRMVARAIQKALPEGTPCVDIKDLKESLPEAPLPMTVSSWATGSIREPPMKQAALS